MLEVTGLILFFVGANYILWHVDRQYQHACREWKMVYRRAKRGY